MTTSTTTTLPARSEVAPADCWDLSGLYATDAAWEAEFAEVERMIPQLEAYRGRLAESAQTLAELLALQTQARRLLDKLRNYAGRKNDEDTADSHYKGLADRVTTLQTRIGEATSFLRPELMATPEPRMQALLADAALGPWAFELAQVLRYKPYTLGAGEERILAMTAELSAAPYDAFGQLNHADLRFGTITDTTGEEVEVTHGSYLAFLTRPDRELRQRFFETYYRGFEQHKHTLASTLSSAIKRDVFGARARGYPSARSAALFADNVPGAVYDNLIAAVHDRLDVLHRYYELRRRTLGLETIQFYDIFVPLVSQIECDYPYESGVELVAEALAPLGEEYCAALFRGLLAGWVDRYENRGKRAGAYSAGCYDSDPFILLNYRADTLDSVYTLAHEAGHSMHSWSSNRRQPPQYADYSIFVAEVASTFNEELLTAHLLAQTDDPRLRAYLINRAIDDMRGTLFRQTMFAEFEQAIHELSEAGRPLTTDSLCATYHAVLERYYGPGFTLDQQLDLECLRIPHFYYNFYVFQYATGISAAIALSRRVLAGESGALTAYHEFLSAGGSRYPVDVLRAAGVDMTRPEPVAAALDHFGELVGQLEQALDQIGHDAS